MLSSNNGIKYLSLANCVRWLQNTWNLKPNISIHIQLESGKWNTISNENINIKI